MIGVCTHLSFSSRGLEVMMMFDFTEKKPPRASARLTFSGVCVQMQPNRGWQTSGKVSATRRPDTAEPSNLGTETHCDLMIQPEAKAQSADIQESATFQLDPRQRGMEVVVNVA